MKTIGLIGGLTYVSSLEYYRLINQLVNQRLGGSEAAKLVMVSVNFGEIRRLTEAGDWDGIAAIICAAAKTIETAGADCILIGANTMHKIADKVQAAVQIPVIHIAAATATAINARGLKKILLLGTKYTMQLDFYRDILAAQGIEVWIPNEAEIEFINQTIYNELSKMQFLPATKQGYLEVINRFAEMGAEGVILGCTEIPLLIKPEESPIPLFDTALIHSAAAVGFALN
jgi:aspartate racemase